LSSEESTTGRSSSRSSPAKQRQRRCRRRVWWSTFRRSRRSGPWRRVLLTPINGTAMPSLPRQSTSRRRTAPRSPIP
jgi:hypothetical protein